MILSVNDMQPHIYAVSRFTSCTATPNSQLPKSTYSYRFMLMTEGSCVVRLNETERDFRRNELLFLLPGERYTILNRYGDFSVMNIYFDFTAYRPEIPELRMHRFSESFHPAFCGERCDFTDTEAFAESGLFQNVFGLLDDFAAIDASFHKKRKIQTQIH